VFGQIKLKAAATGLASFLPVLRDMTCRGTNGTNNPRYCYSVWLRHLLKARASGFEGPFGTVAELGPGDSLGIGLSALLCGSERYIALDAIMHADFAGNVAALRSIAHLFMQRSPVPGEDEFPRVNPKLESYDFPGSLFPEAGPLNCIRPERLARIESELADVGNPQNSLVRYAAPWHTESAIKEGTVDFALSQAVLEHVEDLPAAYRAIARWLKPGGLFSSVVDFKSHGLSKQWWGHWSAGQPAKIPDMNVPPLIKVQSAGFHE